MTDLHVDVHDGDGPYALLVHGMLSSRAQWLLNLEALQQVCRPVVVELLGHGRSHAPAEPHPYTPQGYSEAFESVRSSLGADRWLVIGQSLGAALTLRYVIGRPEVVIAHVFTNSASALADETWQDRMKRGAPAMAASIDASGLAALGSMPIHPKYARRMGAPRSKLRSLPTRR